MSTAHGKIWVGVEEFKIPEIVVLSFRTTQLSEVSCLKLRNILAKLLLKQMHFKDINVILFLPGSTRLNKVRTLGMFNVKQGFT